MIWSFLDAKKGLLGIQFVGKYNEKRIPKYPAIMVQPGPRNKEIHATQTFQILMTVDLWVYHGDLTLTKAQRSEADEKLVADLEALLETDYTWASNPSDPSTRRVIFGYVAEEEPGEMRPRDNKSSIIVGTRLNMRFLSQRRFS